MPHRFKAVLKEERGSNSGVPNNTLGECVHEKKQKNKKTKTHEYSFRPKVYLAYYKIHFYKTLQNH